MSGMRLVFLPAYSPDLNPIEEAFSAIEAWIRANRDYVLGELREKDVIHTGCYDAVFSATPEKALGQFAHSGYIA
jgi:transposase